MSLAPVVSRKRRKETVFELNGGFADALHQFFSRALFFSFFAAAKKPARFPTS